MAAAGALGRDSAGVHAVLAGVVDVEPGGARSSGSGVYYSPNDKTSCGELHADGAQTAAGD